MKTYIFVDKNGNQYGKEIKASSKLKACKLISDYIYFKGNNPYTVTANFKTIYPIILNN